MNEFLKITIPAHKKLSQLAKHCNNKNIFFSAKGGGCNGFTYRTEMFKNSFQYNLEPLKYKPSSLMHCIEQDGYNIYICEYGFKHLVNTTIHWEKNFMNEKFTFENPNAEYVYKCQNSFISKELGGSL